MSWDIFIMDYPREIETANDIPDDFDPPFIGHRSDLIAKIGKALPDADFTNPDWGLLERPGWSIEFNMGDEEKLKSIVLHVRGGSGAVEVIAQILDLLNLRGIETGNGDFFTAGKEAQEGFDKWRRYRDQVVGGTTGNTNSP